VPGLPGGGIDLDALRTTVRALNDDRRRKRLKLVSITHVPSNGGVVCDVAAAVAVVREAAGWPENGGPLVLIDACQVRASASYAQCSSVCVCVCVHVCACVCVCVYVCVCVCAMRDELPEHPLFSSHTPTFILRGSNHSRLHLSATASYVNPQSNTHESSCLARPLLMYGRC
jgi:hypothetical protein